MKKTHRDVVNELLQKTPEERKKAFKGFVTWHPKLHTVINELMFTILNPIPEQIALLIGPTGVGKTTVMNHVAAKILELLLPDMEKDPGIIPVIMMRAPSGEGGHFQFKDFNMRMLSAAHEPLRDKKLKYFADEIVPCREIASYELRMELERIVRKRRVRLINLDEAHRMMRAEAGRSLLNQIECVRHLVQEMCTVIVLVGTYELLDCIHIDAQLSRRCKEIVFPRYYGHSIEDREAFLQVCRTLQERMPVPVTPDFTGHEEYIYKRTIGCVGILKDWFYEALCLAIDERAETVTHRHLQRTAMSEDKVASIALEILEGEDRMQVNKKSKQILDAIWGGETPPPSARYASSLLSPERPTGPGLPPKTSHRPGKRKPRRDPVNIK